MPPLYNVAQNEPVLQEHTKLQRQDGGAAHPARLILYNHLVASYDEDCCLSL
jgi:hypothetical protein